MAREHLTDHGTRTTGGGSPRAARLAAGAAIAASLLLLSACAAGPNPALDTGTDPAGFWLGLWQGFILPVSFIVSLFTDDVSIYEVANSGNWYDFGFVLGASMIFGGGGGGGARAARR
jgi:hypothetical protein